MGLRYERIADDLRDRIADGSLARGERLRSEAALATRYRVSVPTLRQALDLLQAEGLIEKRHGSGNYVRTPQQRVEYANERFRRAWASDRPSLAADGEIEVTVSLRTTEARGGLPFRFDVPARKRLLEYSYRSRFLSDGTPYALTRSYLVRDTFPGRPELPASPSPWGDDFRGMLAAAGIELDHVTERLVARPPSPEESSALGLSRGVAVLALERTSIDTRGVIVEVADAVMSGDRVTAVYTTFTERPGAVREAAGYRGDEQHRQTEERVIREQVAPAGQKGATS